MSLLETAIVKIVGDNGAAEDEVGYGNPFKIVKGFGGQKETVDGGHDRFEK